MIKNKFSIKIILPVFIFILILLIVEIWVNNTLTLYGSKIEKIRETQKLLLLEKQILENEIAQKASLQNIATESAKFGFIKPSLIQYIN